MMHVVNRQVSHVCLHLYCTKSEQGFLQAGDFIIDRLDLLEA